MKKQFVKVLSLVMALMMVVGAFGTMTFAADCAHTNAVAGTPVAATCTSIGYTPYSCPDCGEKYNGNIVMTVGHNYVYVAAKDATCSSKATTEGYKCSVCGQADPARKPTEYGTTLAHNWIKIGEVAATCTAPKKDKFKCTLCSKTENRDISGESALGHDFSYVVKVAATTCGDGLAVRTCKNCNETKDITITASHKYVAFDNKADNKPCEAIESGEKCSLCGKIKEGYKVNENVKHNFSITIGTMDQTAEAMGFTQATLSKAATCAADGYHLAKCSVCGKYEKVVDKKLDHTMGAWTLEGGVAPTTPKADYCVPATSRVRQCANYTNCKYKETVSLKPAVAHELETNTVKPTCTTTGKTTTSCKNCNYKVESGYKDALGHDFGAWTYSGKCTDADGIVATRTCKVTTCKYKDVVKGTQGTCNMTTGSVVKPVAATCATPAHSVWYCTNANCTATTIVPDSYAGEKNPNNHAVELTKYGDKTLATCTTEGVGFYKCTACGATGMEGATKKVAHVTINYTFGPNGVDNGGAGDDVSLAVRAANCIDLGIKTAGEFCKVCKTIVKAPVANSKLDPKTHASTDAAVLIDVVSAKSCTFDQVNRYYYACCGYQNVTGAKADGTSHIWTVVEGVNDAQGADGWFAAKAPTCAAAGNHKYRICKDCAFVEMGDDKAADFCPFTGTDKCTDVHHENIADYTLVYSIAKLEHKLKDVKAVPATCTEIGYTAHKLCEICGYTEGKQPVQPHGTSGSHYQKISDKSATCTATGIKVLNKNSDGKVCTICFNHENKANCTHPECVRLGACKGYITSKIAHDYATFSVGGEKCTDSTFTYKQCKKCGKFEAFSNSFVAGQTAHNYELVWHKVTIKDGYVYVDGKNTNEYACGKKEYEYRKCVNHIGGVQCTAEETRNVGNVVEHYIVVDGAKVDVSLSCTTYSKYVGMSCALCGFNFTADKTVHKWTAPAEKKATCTEKGYYLVTCQDCGTVNKAVTKEFPALEHDSLYMIEKVAPKDAVDGYELHKCSRCDANFKIIIAAPDVTFTFDAVNSLNDKANVVNSGIVSLVIKTSAVKVNVNSIKLAIGYDAKRLTFVGAEVLNSAFANRAYAGAETITVNGMTNETGVVNVAVAAPNSAAGKIQDVTLDGNNVGLVKLNFKVLELSVNEGQAFDGNKAYYETNFWCESAEVLSKDGTVPTSDDKYISVSVIGKEADRPAGVVLTADKDYNYGALALVGNDANLDSFANGSRKVWAVATVKVYALGDVNMDGIMGGAKNATLDDAIALVKIWTNESELGKYSGAADIDKDGAITVADYELLMMYITNEISYNAFLNKGVEPAVKPEGPNVVVNPDGSVTIKPVA